MSIASGSFRAMFFGDFNRERVVEVPDASPDAFRALMKYVYTDEVEITEDNAESVIQLADKYLLAGLFGECVEWLKQMCWERVLRHGDDALNSEAFLSLPQDLLARIFASDQLAADEITVYRRAVDWAKRQLERNDQQENPYAVRATLGTLLYLIRFPLFGAEEFANRPSESGILSAEECISIFQWFNTSKKPPLFSVDVRASSLLDIDRVLQQLGAPRRGTCEHEQGVKTNLKELRKLCATTSIHCQRRHRWICLTCKEAFCIDSSDTCGLYHHSDQTQHGLHFNTDSDDIFCGKCKKYITY